MNLVECELIFTLALSARKKGKGILKIANEFSVGTGTVQRVIKAV